MPDLFPIFTHLPHPTPHAQFSLRYLSTSFRFVFSRLLSHEKTHDMCFFTCLFAFTHSFLSATCQPASGLCFLACSPMKKHTTCVFSLAYLLLHTIFSLHPAYQLPGWVFSLANTRAYRDKMRSAHLALISGRQMHRINACIFLVAITKNAMRLGIPNAWRFINSKLILPFQLKGIHCRSTEAGMKVQSSSLLPRLQHRFPRSQPEISQSQAPYP